MLPHVYRAVPWALTTQETARAARRANAEQVGDLERGAEQREGDEGSEDRFSPAPSSRREAGRPLSHCQTCLDHACRGTVDPFDQAAVAVTMTIKAELGGWGAIARTLLLPTLLSPIRPLATPSPTTNGSPFSTLPSHFTLPSKRHACYASRETWSRANRL